MALPGLAHLQLERLLRAHLAKGEDADTARLCRELRAARTRGYLTRAELEKVCHWKSPRAIRLIRANTPRAVRLTTRAALATPSEERRLAALRRLQGVSVPMASAVLTLLHPRRYGVIDIRVWQLLHRLGLVSRNAGGFGSGHWQEFLVIIRRYAKKLRVRPRDVERALFDIHRAHQSGRLYKARPG